MRIKSADLKNKFLFSSFTAFSASLMQGEAADYHMLLRMIGQIKVSGHRFRRVFVVFFFFLFCSSQNERLPAEMYVWFSCKAIKLSTNTKLEFF